MASDNEMCPLAVVPEVAIGIPRPVTAAATASGCMG